MPEKKIKKKLLCSLWLFLVILTIKEKSFAKIKPDCQKKYGNISLCYQDFLFPPKASKKSIALISDTFDLKIYPLEVNQFSSNLYLTENKKKELFKKAMGDFAKYQALKETFLEKLYEESFKNLLYYSIIELNEGKHPKQSPFFFPEKNFLQIFEQIIQYRLEKYLDLGIGIYSAENELVFELERDHYPFKKGLNSNEKYQVWESALRQNLLAKFRLASVKSFEDSVSISPSSKEITENSVHRYYNQLKKDIKTQFGRDYQSMREIETTLGDYPLLYDFSLTTLEQLHLYRGRDSLTLGQILSMKIDHKIQDKIILQIVKLRNQISYLSKNKKVSELNEIKNQELEKFHEPQGALKNFELANIIDLSINNLDVHSSYLPTKKQIQNDLKLFFQNLKELLSHSHKVPLNIKTKDLSSFISYLLKKSTNSQSFEFYRFASWKIYSHLMYSLKNIKFDPSSLVLKTFKETKVVLKKMLINKKLIEKLLQNRQAYLENNWPHSIILKSPLGNLDKAQAIHYILQEKKSKLIKTKSLNSHEKFILFKKNPSLWNKTIKKWEQIPKLWKMLLLNGGILAAITKYKQYKGGGQLNIKSIGTFDEGYFGKNTSNGGADKTAHLFGTFVVSEFLGHVYQKWGYTPTKANNYSALWSWVIMLYKELGDASIDRNGFSPNDVVFNTIGSFASYLLRLNPELDEFIDLRAEHTWKPNKVAITSDYQEVTYHLVFRGNALVSPGGKLSFLQYFDASIFYYVRNYGAQFNKNNRERNIGIALGFDLPFFFEKRNYPTVSTFLRYIILPGSMVKIKKNLNN